MKYKIVISLFLVSLICAGISYASGSDEAVLKECYSQCVKLFGEYKEAVRNNAGQDIIDSCFQKYRAALDKYKELSGKSGSDNQLKTSSDLPQLNNSGINYDAVQNIINSGAANQQANDGSKISANISSASSGVVMASVLNVRSGPWGEVVGQLKAGAKIEIISKQGSWYKVNFDGREAYIHAGYIATKDSAAEAYEGYAVSENVSVSAVQGGSSIGSLKKGEAVEVLEKRGGWVVIKFNGREAFARAESISKNFTGETSSGIKVSSSAPGNNFNLQASSSAMANIGAKTETAAVSNNGFGTGPAQIGGPVPPAKVTSTYGPRELFGKNFHYGVDLGVPTGTPLRSLGDGKVISTGYDYGGGKTIIIKYANGMTSSYAHCRDASVAVGATVKKGDLVGHTNNTGAYTTGPHLHFSLKDAGNKFVDPLKIPQLWY